MNENACGWMKNVFGERISRMGNFERIFVKKVIILSCEINKFYFYRLKIVYFFSLPSMSKSREI